MKYHDKNNPFRIVRENSAEKAAPLAPLLDSSVLAKQAADVIAWNRQPTPSELADRVRPARVAQLNTLKCGLKILKKEESADKEGELRRLFKE